MSDDASGVFGAFGGTYVPEVLLPAVDAVAAAYQDAVSDPAFTQELRRYNQQFGGRPTPLTHAANLSEQAGHDIYLKREDLVHGGAHKFNNVMGQLLLAKRMGKRRVIAETGAGQHGVATAMAGAALGLEVDVFMGGKDIARQRPNVDRMRLLGADVVPVGDDTTTLKDAVNESLRQFATDPEVYYCIGSVVGPHPYPTMVRDFQRVIGDEAREQFLDQVGRLPEHAVACVGGGSNAIGTFTAFLKDPVTLHGIEAGGDGNGAGAAALSHGTPGILHGAHTYILQDSNGQVQTAQSISAGLDYPAVGPEHSALHAMGRVQYGTVTDAEALDAARLTARSEGILPALESSHAIAHALRMDSDGPVLVTLSGRGDKDLARLAEGQP